MSADLPAMKAKLKAAWMAGDYARFATYMLPGSLEFLPALALRRGDRVLDVGCGAGQLALPAARAGAVVTGVDIASNLVEAARRRAESDLVSARFDEGDAEALAFPDASFDVVFSFIGAMFAPRPELVAAEMTRVCRPGGRIAMGNWTPGGFVGSMFRTVGRHLPAPGGIAPAVMWGDPAVVHERFKGRVADLATEPRMFPFTYPFAPRGVVDLFRTCYGPVVRAFATLDAPGQAALDADLLALWTAANRATDGTTRVDAEYLIVTATR